MANNDTAECQNPFCDTERLLVLKMYGQNSLIVVAALFAIANESFVLQAKHAVHADFPATQPSHPLLHETKYKIFSLSESTSPL